MLFSFFLILDPIKLGLILFVSDQPIKNIVFLAGSDFIRKNWICDLCLRDKIAKPFMPTTYWLMLVALVDVSSMLDHGNMACSVEWSWYKPYYSICASVKCLWNIAVYVYSITYFSSFSP